MTILRRCLVSKFEVKHLNPLLYIIGMEVAKLRRGILTLRRKYVPDLLKEAWMKVCRPSDTLTNPGQKLTRSSGKRMITSCR